MPGPYQTLTERGDRWPENRRLHVLLYPNTPAEVPATTAGETVPAAVTHGADQLFDADAVSYYRLQRFPAESDAYRYPRVGPDEVYHGFQDYLRGGAERFSDRSWRADGGGESLAAYRGVHLLVHGHGFGTTLAGAAPDSCEDGGSAFSRGAAAWTGVDDDRVALARNSAIHEVVHLCVRTSLDGVRTTYCDANGDGEKSAYEEHTLGRITRDGAVTPLLTYHVDEHAGCRGEEAGSWDGSYTPELTDRSKAAVARTARNQCRPQPGVTEYPGEEP